MSAIKNGKWVPVFIAVGGFILGQAMPQVWNWKESRREEVKLIIDLRDKVEDKLTKLYSTAEELRQADTDIRKKEIQSKFDIIKDDLITIENKSAGLENRKPRDIFKELKAPSAPSNFSIIVVPRTK